jgi:hypothetical protein
VTDDLTPDAPGVHLRVRVSLDQSDPLIWRLLELDASLTLDRVHDVIQIAFGWQDSHLHSFSSVNAYGPRPKKGDLAVIPRRWFEQELLEEGQSGQPEEATTLGQAMAVASGALFYEYDFGDSGLHSIELIEVFRPTRGDPPAHLVRGDRGAPLEDSGGVPGFEHLLEVLRDPSDEEFEDRSEWVHYVSGPWREFDAETFDADAVNRELGLLFDPRKKETPLAFTIAERLPRGRRGELRSYLSRAADGPATVDDATAERMLRPYLWFVRRIGADGLPLTAAGWLPPLVVSDAMRELGWESRWVGKMNREDQTYPILELRESAQRLGVFRKLKGRLVLSKAAKVALETPTALWPFLATALVVRARTEAQQNANLLLAAEIALGSHTTRASYLEPITAGLDALGWSEGDGDALTEQTVDRLIDDVWRVLSTLGVFASDASRRGVLGVTEEGQAFARAILRV